jgi:transketolase
MNKDIYKIRKKIIELSYNSSSAHLGSSLSCVEILYSIFDLINKNKKFIDSEVIFSKGHASMAYLSVLEHFKLIPKINSKNYLSNDSKYWGHISRKKKSKYFKFSFGSLGCGLGIASGLAFDFLNKNINKKIFVLLSDGELNEGSTFEAAQFISHHNLNNMIVLIDNNKIQSFDKTKNILDTPYTKIFNQLNFGTVAVDGHNISTIKKVIKKNLKTPSIIFCNTIKGKGIKKIENKIESHYFPAKKEDLYK